MRERVEDINAFIERFALEFTRANDIRYRGFMPDAVRMMKQYAWPGNVRELKHFVEKVLVLEKGERISGEMVDSQLGKKQIDLSKNETLPVLTNQPTDAAERDLILRQLFLLRQDVEFLKQLASPTQAPIGNINTPLINNSESHQPAGLINEDSEYFIKNSSIGDMTIEDLEKEAIIRTLKFFKNNRRASAKSLGMSERTLYRKINFYGLERKIKNQ